MSDRLLQVVLQPKQSGEVIPKQFIGYKNSSFKLTDEERASLEASLPEFWHTDKDKLTRFEKWEDMYVCERYKDVFDYRTRVSTKKFYRFDVHSQEQADELYHFFLNFYSKCKIARIENVYQQIQDKVGDLSFIKYSLLASRDALLAKSDWTQLPDSPLSDDEKARWQTYRQELRDLTDQPAWTDNLIDVVMPVSPNPQSQLDTFADYMGQLASIPSDLYDEELQQWNNGQIDDIIRRVSAVSVKFELIKSLQAMKLPILEIDFNTVDDTQNYYDESLVRIREEIEGDNALPSDWWTTATSDLDALIQNIDTKLQSYNIEFTINDILNSVMEDTKRKEEAMQLLGDIQEDE